MRKTPLVRKTPLTRDKPLKRGTKPLKKTPLAQRSKEKIEWEKLYQEQGERDSSWQRDAMTGQRYPKEQLERHHPFGRHGRYILLYCYLLPINHIPTIHDNSTWGRETGWLQPPYWGMSYDSDWPRPWLKGTLINENML